MCAEQLAVESYFIPRRAESIKRDWTIRPTKRDSNGSMRLVSQHPSR